MMYTKKINLPNATLKIMFHVKRETEKEHIHCNDFLIVAGGRKPDAAWLSNVSIRKKVYCADKGAAYCLDTGIIPDEIYGDCDSAAIDIYKKAELLGSKIYYFSPAKDDTDLMLLLNNLPEGNIIATGIWGGRFDHLYSNIYSLLSLKNKRQCQVVMADEKELMLFMNDGESTEIKLNKTPKAVSILPLSSLVNVDISGVRWPLHKAELQQLYPYAISNEVFNDNIFSCCCYSGSLGLYIHWQ